MIPPGADEIRAGVPADAPVLTRVAHAAKRHWGYPEEWIRTWCGDLTVTAEYIEHHPIYVAERAGCAVGFVGLELSPGQAEVDHMWVLPEWMGRGIGRVLMERAQRHCRDRRVERLRVVSDPHAKDFYLRMGAYYEGEYQSTPAPRTLPVLRFDLVP